MVNLMKETDYSIRFNSSEELYQLCCALDNLDIGWGSSNDSCMDLCNEYGGVFYFANKDNGYLSIDCSKLYVPRYYMSCGLGYKNTIYEYQQFMDIYGKYLRLKDNFKNSELSREKELGIAHLQSELTKYKSLYQNAQSQLQTIKSFINKIKV